MGVCRGGTGVAGEVRQGVHLIFHALRDGEPQGVSGACLAASAGRFTESKIDPGSKDKAFTLILAFSLREKGFVSSPSGRRLG